MMLSAPSMTWEVSKSEAKVSLWPSWCLAAAVKVKGLVPMLINQSGKDILYWCIILVMDDVCAACEAHTKYLDTMSPDQMNNASLIHLADVPRTTAASGGVIHVCRQSCNTAVRSLVSRRKSFCNLKCSNTYTAFMVLFSQTTPTIIWYWPRFTLVRDYGLSLFV